ncbi:MAG: HD domain-containing protein [Actinomycetaceae bacterium]|nr:HD domain-containing protein [Actinomycetaceae bacterium]MDY6082371.1 HD domain-containing protein [Actinomycetaceae bacterium]
MDAYIKRVVLFVQQHLGDDRTGHDVAHAYRVVQLALRIIELMPEVEAARVNRRLVQCAAWVHDVIDPKVAVDVQATETELRAFLETLDFTEAEVDEIFFIITHMSFSKNIESRVPLSLNGQIVQDADRLDAIGVIGVARALYYGGAHGDVLYDPAVAPRVLADESEYREPGTVINHFYEKLFQLKDLLNTDAARQIGEKRDLKMHSFVDDFRAEWEGSDVTDA